MTAETTRDPQRDSSTPQEADGPLLAPAGTPASECPGKSHVLVINDTQEILDLFRDILEEEGYAVTLSSFAFQEVAEVERLAPDVIVLDFLIGGEALGWQMLQKLRMYRPTAHIPIVVCTAAIQLVRELQGHLRAKDVFVVLKPFDIDEMVSVVNLALGTAADPASSTA